MNKKIAKGLRFASLAALIGYGIWGYQNRSNKAYEKRFEYDNALAAQDSTYAVRMAEAVFAYIQDQNYEAERILHEANGPTYAQVLKNELSYNYRLGDASRFDDGKSGGTVFTVDRLCTVSRQNKKGQIVLRNQDNPEQAVWIDTLDLRDLQNRANECAKRENVAPLSVKFVMCEVNNARVALDYVQPKCISYTLSTLRDHDKKVALDIMSHEYRHVRHMQHGYNYPAYDLHGHEKNIAYFVKEDVSEEGDCDAASATSPYFDAFSLAGNAYFNISDWIPKDEWTSMRDRTSLDVIPNLAKSIFNINKYQIETMGTHPPALYRFVNMAKEAHIDLNKVAHAVNKHRQAKVNRPRSY